MGHLYALVLLALLDNAACSSTSSDHQEKREEEQQNLPVHEVTVKDELNLPCGYRFCPDDSELIIHYLANKIFGRRLPANIIKDFDVYEHDPDQLPISEFVYGKGNEAYFFTQTELKYQKGMRPKRTTVSGYWKATGGDVKIYRGDGVVGFKKIFVFYWGKAPNGEKTSWIMHEYRLNPKLIPVDPHNDTIGTEIGRRVICRIRYKNKILEGVQEQKAVQNHQQSLNS